jgi:hypothetical protein
LIKGSKDIKRTYNNVDPDMMIDMSFTYRTEGRWLKNIELNLLRRLF